MRKHKYSAIATVIDGIRFPSRREARRYEELRLLEKIGEIRELELQPAFPLYVLTPDGKQVPVCTYKADFRYRCKARGVVVEDSKGMPTPLYKLKKKMTETQYAIRIHEV